MRGRSIQTGRQTTTIPREKGSGMPQCLRSSWGPTCQSEAAVRMKVGRTNEWAEEEADIYECRVKPLVVNYYNK